MRKLGAGPDCVTGSAHAVTEDGHLQHMLDLYGMHSATNKLFVVMAEEAPGSASC